MSYYWFNRQDLLQKTKKKYDNGGNERLLIITETIKMS